MDRDSLIDISKMSNVIMIVFVTWTVRAEQRDISHIVETFSSPGSSWVTAGRGTISRDEAGRGWARSVLRPGRPTSPVWASLTLTLGLSGMSESLSWPPPSHGTQPHYVTDWVIYKS